VEAELARLEAVGLVDDEAFALDLARHHLVVRRSGRRAVASALAAKGVARSTIERALEDLGGDEPSERERAADLATERARRLRGVAPEAAFGRLVSFLARRGYDHGTARWAARTALGVEAAED
jgi:regulatory protein